MRPKKYPYKQNKPFPPMKRVVSAITELEFLQDLYNQSSDTSKPRIKALVQKKEDYVNRYDLEIVPIELATRFHELLGFFEKGKKGEG